MIYQVYVRSFADGNGDGIGDLAGVRSRLPYLKSLGVDALWFTPWYRSPLADGGYDVQDYRLIDPRFGTLEEAEQLIAEALEYGIRTIVDIVPNHISDRHEWFQQALAAQPGSPERQRFWFHPGRGRGRCGDADELGVELSGRDVDAHAEPRRHPRGVVPAPVHNRSSPISTGTTPMCGASTKTSCASGSTAESPGCASTRRPSRSRTPALPDLPAGTAPASGHPHIDRDELHDIYRDWRAVADEYDGERVLVGEVWLDDAERFARYLRPGEMHTAFNFGFMTQPWNAQAMRDSITRTLAEHAPVGAPATWVLSNHDVTAAGHPLRAGRFVVRVRAQEVRHPDGRGSRRASGPRGIAARRQRSPAVSTSTRATSSVCPRWSCRSTRSRTPCTSVPGVSIRDAMDAGFRCPGRGR